MHFYFLVVIQLTNFSLLFRLLLQALNHPYFFALPYPTHPSKLPKTAAQTAASSRPLDEVDGNVDPSGGGPTDKAAGSKKLKRKLSGSDLSRNIARKLDFTASAS
jgi:cyclin-dependent kinase 7